MGGAYLGDHEGYRDDFGADSIVLDEENSMWPLSQKMSDRNGRVLYGYLLNLTASVPIYNARSHWLISPHVMLKMCLWLVERFHDNQTCKLCSSPLWVLVLFVASNAWQVKHSSFAHASSTGTPAGDCECKHIIYISY